GRRGRPARSPRAPLRRRGPHDRGHAGGRPRAGAAVAPGLLPRTGRGRLRRPLRDGADPRRRAVAAHPSPPVRARHRRRPCAPRRPLAGPGAGMVAAEGGAGGRVVPHARRQGTGLGPTPRGERRCSVSEYRTKPTPPIELDGPVDGLRQRFPPGAGIDDMTAANLRSVCASVDTDLGARIEAGRDWWPLTMAWAVAG